MISSNACLIAKNVKKYDDLESNYHVGSEHFPKDSKFAFPFSICLRNYRMHD